MSDENLHQKIEEHITSSMAALLPGMKYSLNIDDARDFSLPEAPLLVNGVDPFIVFEVNIERGQGKTIGNTTISRIGLVRAEIHLLKSKTDREFYTVSGKVSEFLERKNFNGVLMKDGVNNGKFTRGNFKVMSWSFDFKSSFTVA